MDRADVADEEEMLARLRREHPEHVAFIGELLETYGLEPVPPRAHRMSPSAIDAQLEVVLEEAPNAFASGLGDAASFIPRAREVGIKVLGLVGRVRHVERQRRASVDLIVAQGYEAGGHVGTIATFALLPQVVDAADPIPVIAAGGIGDGRGVAAALALGACGVWVGTAFLLAEESNWHTRQREEIVAGESEDFVVTRAYTGKPARDHHNEIIARWHERGLEPLPMPLQGVLMEPFVAAAEAAGRYDLVNNPSGQIAGMLGAVRPAREIVESLISGAVRSVDHLHELTSSVPVPGGGAGAATR